MFWPMRSQRQLPHQIPRPVPRLPLTPPAQGQNVFSSTVFCLHTACGNVSLLEGNPIQHIALYTNASSVVGICSLPPDMGR